LNISPGSLFERCRVVAIRIGTREAPSADSAAGMSTPCNGRPAQQQQASANIKAPAARKSLGVLAAVTPLRTWPMLARKVQHS
jgi:hypothetical protein